MSAIPCISMAGLLDVKIHTGTSDGDTFYSFVQTHLLPQLMPYDVKIRTQLSLWITVVSIMCQR